MNVLPYQTPRRSRVLDRLVIGTALFAVVIIGPAAVGYAEGLSGKTKATVPAVSAKQRPTWGPHGTAFGTMKSSGDSVVDCGEMADHDMDLTPAAAEVLEHCLDLHGWTYDR